jgi:hypothetical protein
VVIKINNGAIFCKTIRSQILGHDRVEIISGYQQKAGGPPSFIRIANWNKRLDQWAKGVIERPALVITMPEVTA